MDARVLDHPFEKLTRHQLAWATALVGAAWALLTAVLVHAISTHEIAQIQRLLEASSPVVASSVLSEWPASVFSSFAFLLGFDLLYDVVHNNATALFAIWGARRLGHPVAALAGRGIAWVLWLDTALNLFENLAFLHVIRALEPWPLLPWAAGIFSFRSATLGAGIVVGVVLHGLAFWQRSARRQSR